MLWSVWQLQMEKQQQEPVSLVGISHCKFVIIDKVAWLGRFKTEQIDMHQSICAMVNTIYHKGCVLQFQKTRFKTRNTTYWNVQIHVPSLPTSWRKIYFAGIPVTLFKSRQPLLINVSSAQSYPSSFVAEDSVRSENMWECLEWLATFLVIQLLGLFGTCDFFFSCEILVDAILWYWIKFEY